jgi:hypothetical protein
MFHYETKWKTLAAFILGGVWPFPAPSSPQKPSASLPPFFGFIFHASSVVHSCFRLTCSLKIRLCSCSSCKKTNVTTGGIFSDWRGGFVSF